jgi:hypothetical protein
MAVRLLRLAGAAIFLGLSISPAAACGGGRWSVKVAADRNAALIADYARTADIAALGALAAPGDPQARQDTRFLPTEGMVYEVSGTLLSVQGMADGDLRLVVAGRNDPQTTIVAVAPAAACAQNSRFADNIVAVRHALLRRFGQVSWLTPGLPATLTGIAYFAVRRGEPSAAANGIELHPLIGVAFP